MGSATSKPEEELVVSLCKERKYFLKLAIERRNTFADAHSRYIDSFLAIAAAIKLFVTQHSSPSSPFLISFHPCVAPLPNDNIVSNPISPQQIPSKSTEEPKGHHLSICSISSDSSEAEREEELGREEEVCPYFYVSTPPLMPSPQRDSGWDFFNTFNMVRPEMEDLEETILVERNVGVTAKDDKSGVAIVKVTDGANVSLGGYKGLMATDTPTRELELLKALKDVEDDFIKAYDSVKDISKMLEAKRVHLQPSLEEIKENSIKLNRNIKWRRSTMSWSTSSKSLLSSSPKSSSTCTELKSGLYDDYGGMESGSHSMTLGRLYAWENKLYEEVKAGNHMRKMYERKCTKLRNKDVRGDDKLSMDKPGSAVKDLYTRILVGIRTAEMTSKRIQKLRDEELQPQLIELLQGLMRTWKIMLESHETQKLIMSEVKAFTCPAYGKFCDESHRLATLKLYLELQNWCACFTEWFSAQRAYVEALNGWLSKFFIPEVEFYSRAISLVPPYIVNGPPLLMICHDWLTSLKNLPVKAVTCSMKSFAKDVRALWVQHGKELQQKRKVESLTKEFDRRVHAFERAENSILEPKLSETKAVQDMQHQVEYLAERKDLLIKFRKRLEAEKTKHHNFMQDTQRITLNGFQTGLSLIFKSLVDFSKASLKIYNDVLTYSEKAK